MDSGADRTVRTAKEQVTMNVLPQSNAIALNASYETTRFNAMQHGVLSRHTILPWEDPGEYQALWDGLVTEYAPSGPTEGHLVEELAGIIWRKRRLRLAEAAIYREQLRKDVTGNDANHIAGAALLATTGIPCGKVDLPEAFATTTADTARDLRDVKRDLAMTRKAERILAAGETGAYGRALAALREDTRTYWLECVEDADDRSCQPTAEALEAWLYRNRKEFYEDPIAELEHRDAIKEQAFGSAYAAERLEVTARYEVHLDRKLERTLSMLFRMRELRRPAAPG
jgi:hypothetical protein